MMFTFYMMRGGGGGESLETAATCVCGVDGGRRKDTHTHIKHMEPG